MTVGMLMTIREGCIRGCQTTSRWSYDSVYMELGTEVWKTCRISGIRNVSSRSLHSICGA